MTQLVLSLFPGIGLLDRAFEEEGFTVVRGPDLLWGGDVRAFHAPAGRFDGVIGGPPCQAFSRLRHIVAANGYKTAPNLIPEYERIVAEAAPAWFVMENVPEAPPAGAMWAVSVRCGDEVVGVALVGHHARAWNCKVLTVIRVAVLEGHQNACSMLYGACSRAGQAMGAEDVVTYTHLDENGASLKAANWIEAGLSDDDAEWDRDARPRQLAIDPEAKRRWFAPWGKRAKAVMAERQRRTA